jgi:uncharacterized membrane protein
MSTTSSTTPRRFSLSRLFDDPYRLLLALAVLLYIWIFTSLAFDLHTGMRTHKADLGQMDQAIWNTSRGRFVESIQNDYVSSRLTDHVEPIYALISPVLWVWDDVRALLLLQVVAVAVGAIPLYALALEKLNQLLPLSTRRLIWHREPMEQLTRPIAMAIAIAYLLAPQLQAAVLTEFHAIPLSVPLILWAFWAVERQRWWQFAIAALLITSVKEEAALLGAGLGAWAMWRIIGCWLLVVDWRGEEAERRGRAGADGDSSRNTHHGTRTTDYALRITHYGLPFTIALTVTLLSLAWFYVATFVVVPAYANPIYGVAESTYFQRYGALGGSPADIFKSFFTQPGVVWQIATEPARVDYLWGLLAVFSFLCLLAPEILLLVLPLLLANMLSAFAPQYYGEFHYSAPLVPYVAVAAAYGTGRLWRSLARRASRQSGSFQHMPAASAPVMALTAFFTNAQNTLRPMIATTLVIWLLIWAGVRYLEAGHGPLGGRYSPTPITEHHRLLPRFTAQIPADAAVSATAAVHPHVSHRRYVYQFPWGVEPTEKANWALLDVTTNTDMAPGDLKATVERMLAADWGIVDAADGFLLLRKGADAKEIPDAFYTFARVRGSGTGDWIRNSQLAIRNSASFGPLTYLGLELEDWPRWRQTKVTTLWRVEEGFEAGTVRPRLGLHSATGELLYDHDTIAPPALVWYPPGQWQPGEIIRLETLWLFLPRHWGAAVGVVHGPNPLMAADRLPVVDPAQGSIVDESGTLALVAAFARQTDDSLAALPVAEDLLPTAVKRTAYPRTSELSGSFGDGHEVRVTAWLPTTTMPAGDRLDLWLEWQTGGTRLLQNLTAFIHLRDAEGNISQNDGAPRYFVHLSKDQEILADWRQLHLPPDLPAGYYDLVIGLFDPITGERLTAFDAGNHPTGNELFLGRIQVGAPRIPDQACALIPLTCASQAE